MYCARCGGVLESGACPYCGLNAENNQGNIQTENTTNTHSATVTVKKKSSPLGIILSIIFGVVILAGLGWLLASGFFNSVSIDDIKVTSNSTWENTTNPAGVKYTLTATFDNTSSKDVKLSVTMNLTTGSTKIDTQATTINIAAGQKQTVTFYYQYINGVNQDPDEYEFIYKIV